MLLFIFHKLISNKCLVLVGMFLVTMKVSFDFALQVSTNNIQRALEQAEASATLDSILNVVAAGVADGSAAITGTGAAVAATTGAMSGSSFEYVDPGPKSKFSYAIVIGGVDVEKGHYRGFLYNILVATHILRQRGSAADMVAYFQLTWSAPGETLPPEDLRLLSALGVRVKYIPKTQDQSFYSTVMEKFRVLDLLEYQRVLLMDGDIMPVTNLDYLFTLSTQGVLKENLVVSGSMEPSNAGFFMVAPGPGEYERILEIIKTRAEKAVDLPWPNFDEVNGWGHTITAPDYWRSRRERGTLWNFHFAFSDQGLLFHYAKYVKKSVSIVYNHNEVENWGESKSNGTMVLEETLPDVFTRERELLYREYMACNKFMCDFIHFSGNRKPWLKKPDKEYKADQVVNESSNRIWWHALYELDRELSMDLDFDDWKVGVRPTLGMYATHHDVAKKAKSHAKTKSSEELEPSSAEAQSSEETQEEIKAAAAVEAQPTAPERRLQEAPEETSTSLDVSEPSKYAYAFVIGGCNPEDGKYRGFLYNVMVATRVLREEGSRADVVVFVQMAFLSKATELPEEDTRVLSALGAKVQYIPKIESEGFYDTVLSKFRILTLTQYRRVILLDADVMPVANTDFLFELSDGSDAVLKENVLIMGPWEPANAGIFLLTPGPFEYKRITEIIRRREEEAKNIESWPKFDETKGWGHEIEEGDEWETRKGKTGVKWDFHFAYSDQGLLYHWAKYEKKSVSIIKGYAGKEVQNWGAKSSDGKVALEETLDGPFRGVAKPRVKIDNQCKKYLCEFVHFSGNDKPWLSTSGPVENYTSEKHRNSSAKHIWWSTLNDLNTEFSMDLDFANWTPTRPPHGTFAKIRELNARALEPPKKLGRTTTKNGRVYSVKKS